MAAVIAAGLTLSMVGHASAAPGRHSCPRWGFRASADTPSGHETLTIVGIHTNMRCTDPNLHWVIRHASDVDTKYLRRAGALWYVPVSRGISIQRVWCSAYTVSPTPPGGPASTTPGGPLLTIRWAVLGLDGAS